MDRQEEVEMLAPSEKTKKYRLDGIDKPELKPIFASFFLTMLEKLV
jgi:endonuclease YncB( thermonuclease family)